MGLLFVGDVDLGVYSLFLFKIAISETCGGSSEFRVYCNWMFFFSQNFEKHHKKREEMVSSLKNLSAKYTAMIQEEIKKKPEQLVVDRAGRVDAKMRIETTLDTLMTDTLLQSLGSMISTLVF